MLHLHHRRRRVVVRHREALGSGLSRQGWRCKKSAAWVWQDSLDATAQNAWSRRMYVSIRAMVVLMAQWLGYRRGSLGMYRAELKPRHSSDGASRED